MDKQLATEIVKLYQDYPEVPYISPKRDVAQWLRDYQMGKQKLVPKRNMVKTEEGLMPGQVIYLWLISLGTHTTENWTPKYFEYTYGIDGPVARQALVDGGYVRVATAFESLNHVTVPLIKHILKAQGITGLSKLNKRELEQLLRTHVSEEALGQYFDVRGYLLTEKGERALINNQAIVDKHPKKQF